MKSRLGWAPKAYEFVIGSDRGDILVILRQVAADVTIAYVPYGPEMFPEVGEGAFLEALSECLHTDPLGPSLGVALRRGRRPVRR